MNIRRHYSASVILVFVALGFGGCWAVAAGAGAEAGYIASQKDRSVGETVDDQAIVTSVKTQLLADSEVSGLDINVDSYKGNVTLKGVVDSARELQKAVEIARNTSGVRNVTSKLVID